MSSDSHDGVRLFLGRVARYRESLGRMVCRMRVKATQFVRHVKELTNVAPMQYLNSCRFEHARRLLKSSPSMSINRDRF